MTTEFRNCEATILQNALPYNFVQEGAGNLREMTAEFSNCEATILQNALPYNFVQEGAGKICGK